MTVLPPGHGGAVASPRPLAARERRLVSAVAVAGVIAVVAVVLALVLSGGGSTRGRGCISVALAYSTGGEQIDRCGADARAVCAGVGHPGGIVGEPARVVSRACRRAGLSVG